MKFLHFQINLEPSTPRELKRRYQSRTMAIQEPSSADVKALLNTYLTSPGPLTVDLEIGTTFLSIKDKYVRKTGRQEASARMKKETFTVTGILITDTHVFVHLNEHKDISLALRMNKATGFTTVVGKPTFASAQ